MDRGLFEEATAPKIIYIEKKNKEVLIRVWSIWNLGGVEEKFPQQQKRDFKVLFDKPAVKKSRRKSKKIVSSLGNKKIVLERKKS